MGTRRIGAALVLPLVLFTAKEAAAQGRNARLVQPPDAMISVVAPRRNLPAFRIAEDPTRPGQPPRNGLIAAWPVSETVTVGVGRFIVVDPPRPRTNMESDRQSTSYRSRERGVAAIGMSLRFR